MTTPRGVAISILILSIIVFGVFLGCGSKETADTEATADHSMQTMDKPAAETTEAAEATGEDLAAYDNPKVGICPVCQMTLEEGYIEVASIGDKKYACCSAGCVAALTQDPDTYLMTSDKGHEGHSH